MKRNRIILLSAGLAAFTVLLVYFWGGNSADYNTDVNRRKVGGLSSKFTLPTSKHRADNIQSVLAKVPDISKLDHMIAESEDKLGSTVAAFVMSFDDKYLEELSKYSSSAKACTLLACFSKTPDQQSLWADKLLEVEPDNQLAVLIKVKALMSTSKETEALLLARNLSEETKFKIPELEILADVSSGWRALGYDESTSKQLAVNNGASGSFCSLFKYSFSKIWNAKLKSQPSEDDLVQAASVQLQMINNFARALRPSFQLETYTRAMEQSVLDRLPGDVEFGREGYTVTAYKRDVQLNNQALANSFKAAQEMLATADPEVVNKYNDKRFLEGDAAASAWLLALVK